MRFPTSTMLLLVFAGVPLAHAVSIDFVPVGSPGNAADTRYSAVGRGSVGYDYQIGKFEVTAGQYCEFLNAVARTDPYDLYSIGMDASLYPEGSGIQRSGSPGSYTYSVASGWANRPVNYVSWADAARFCNWLSNGQPTGDENLSTTEDGSYLLNAATSTVQLANVSRKPGARFVIPSEDEWYKAAYYDPEKTAGAGYWDYPTRANDAPSSVFDPSGSNNATYRGYVDGTNQWTIGEPYYRTEVGSFANSSSAYGTFDQGGNVAEWNETEFQNMYRGLRGGAYSNLDADEMAASNDGYVLAPNLSQFSFFGFRVALVPEPATLGILAAGGLGLLRHRRSRAD